MHLTKAPSAPDGNTLPLYKADLRKVCLKSDLGKNEISWSLSSVGTWTPPMTAD